MTGEWDVSIVISRMEPFNDNKAQHEALGWGAVVSEGKGQCR